MPLWMHHCSRCSQAAACPCACGMRPPMWPHVLSVAARDAALIELHGDGAGVAAGGVDHSAVLSACGGTGRQRWHHTSTHSTQ